MFSAQETQWLQSIIEAMHNQGYKYYLARTVTENNNEYDVLVVFSESPIIGNGLYSYKIVDGVVYSFDSSGYSSYNNNNARVAVSSFNGTYSVAQYEHVYTNAEFSGATLQPDIRSLGGANNVQIKAVPFLVVLLILVLVGFKLFR